MGEGIKIARGLETWKCLNCFNAVPLMTFNKLLHVSTSISATVK